MFCEPKIMSPCSSGNLLEQLSPGALKVTRWHFFIPRPSDSATDLNSWLGVFWKRISSTCGWDNRV